LASISDWSSRRPRRSTLCAVFDITTTARPRSGIIPAKLRKPHVPPLCHTIPWRRGCFERIQQSPTPRASPSVPAAPARTRGHGHARVAHAPAGFLARRLPRDEPVVVGRRDVGPRVMLPDAECVGELAATHAVRRVRQATAVSCELEEGRLAMAPRGNGVGQVPGQRVVQCDLSPQGHVGQENPCEDLGHRPDLEEAQLVRCGARGRPPAAGVRLAAHQPGDQCPMGRWPELRQLPLEVVVHRARPRGRSGRSGGGPRRGSP